ncbi:hypothetical protein diail_9997 [Diaporthe ilicicola]|nr:hypothetical protein diail_9997 [Diaporthe ilicicola]
MTSFFAHKSLAPCLLDIGSIESVPDPVILLDPKRVHSPYPLELAGLACYPRQSGTPPPVFEVQLPNTLCYLLLCHDTSLLVENPCSDHLARTIGHAARPKRKWDACTYTDGNETRSTDAILVERRKPELMTQQEITKDPEKLELVDNSKTSKNSRG